MANTVSSSTGERHYDEVVTENRFENNNDERLKIAAFFSGVGGIELGFENTGEFSVVYANEFDRNACVTYRENHPDTPLDERDIHKVDPNNIPDPDLIVGGFPCQAFSIAGYRLGFEDDRGDLFFELLRIIKAKQPETVFIENVKNMVTHDHGNTFKIIREALVMNGYFIKWKVLNAKDYGDIPQNRERIYLVGFRSKEAYEAFDFPDRIERTIGLRQVINFGLNAEERYYYGPDRTPFWAELEPNITRQDTVYQWRRQYVRENRSGVVPTLTANMGTGGHNVPLILTDDGRIRKLTPQETFSVQGFPKDFVLPENVANGQLYKQAGNSVVVPVIERIAQNISEAMQETTENANRIPEIPEKQNSYLIMHTVMDGHFSGKSKLVDVIPGTIEALEQYRNENKVEFMNHAEYIRTVKKLQGERHLDFYSYEYNNASENDPA
ncbi:DNA cytosine methyltransferase [Enterococcus gilvus]|uniref:DNA cytosine methyltransferase n=1 Tax=Enterococcus gilvus TaxID=160453 RepID=UPI003D6C661E